VDGIDVLFVGPWDLGNNLGFPVTGDFAPELKAAIARIQKAAKDAGKWSGIYCPTGDFARRYADEGFQMVSEAPSLRLI
jgi:4-hydroxy-2-oxoheptanedioate aldolase